MSMSKSQIPLDQLRARSTGTASDDLSAAYLDEIRSLREENKRLRAEKHETSLAQEILAQPVKRNHDGHLGHEGAE